MVADEIAAVAAVNTSVETLVTGLLVPLITVADTLVRSVAVVLIGVRLNTSVAVIVSGIWTKGVIVADGMSDGVTVADGAIVAGMGDGAAVDRMATIAVGVTPPESIRPGTTITSAISHKPIATNNANRANRVGRARKMEAISVPPAASPP